MNRKSLKWRIRYYLQYFPLTLNAFVFAALCLLFYKLLYRPLPRGGEEPSAFLPFILLMAKMAFWFVLIVVALSALSTLFVWLHFLWLRHNKGVRLELSFVNEKTDRTTGRSIMQATLQGALRPILGFVNGRLYYDDHQLTEHFALLSDKKKENSLFLRSAISGKSRLLLPDVREYQLKGGFIYFRDMLHLFSLAVEQQISGSFYQPPEVQSAAEKDVFPKKTETTDVRIDQMRRVDGEYLNYKDFEHGDDVRRIVWKVYAKSRDLVVRVPEMFEPYASHLYFYASFENSLGKNWTDNEYAREMLNYYKNSVWTIYDSLSKKEWQLRYVPDQQFNLPEHLNSAERSARIISNSTWQQDKELRQYFNPRQGAVLCISSFSDPVQLQHTLDECDPSTVVYFVRCSKVFHHFVAWSWLKRLILLPPKDRLNKVRSRWVFSPLRFQLTKREKKIEEILKQSRVITGYL